MSELRTRPRPPAGGAGASAVTSGETRRPLTVTALLAAGVVAGGGLVIALGVGVVAWLVAGAAQEVSAPLRAGALGWLLAHGAPLDVDGVRWSLVPLGLTVLAAWGVARGARWTAGSRADAARSERALGAVVLAAAYLAALVLVAVLASRPGTEVDLVGLLGRGGLLVAAATTWGTLQAGEPWRTLLPRWAVAVLETAAVVVLGLLTLAALALAVALSLELDQAATVMAGLALGEGDAVVFGLLMLAALPSAVVWSAAYLLGPGFALGVDTVVSVQQVSAGPVPALPLLAAVPSGPAPAWLAVVVLALPVLLAAGAGAAVARRHAVADWRHALGLGVGGGLLASLALAALGALAAGSAGSGRLAEVGPSGVSLLLAALLPLTLGAVAGAVGRVLLDGRLASGPVSTEDAPSA